MKPKQKIIIEIFPKTLKRLREQKNWSQGQLAKKLAVDVQSVSKYERGVVCPPPDTMLQMADLFEVSLDFLMRGEQQVKIEEIRNQELLRRFKEIHNLPGDDQKMVLAVLDAFIKKHRLEYAAQSRI